MAKGGVFEIQCTLFHCALRSDLNVQINFGLKLDLQSDLRTVGEFLSETTDQTELLSSLQKSM